LSVPSTICDIRPAVVDPSVHARQLAHWLRTVANVAYQDLPSSLTAWLDMTAGLRINIEPPYETMCSAAAEHDEVALHTASIYHLAVTRLLYAGSALMTTLTMFDSRQWLEMPILHVCRDALAFSPEASLLHEECILSTSSTRRRADTSLDAHGIAVAEAGLSCWQRHMQGGFWIPEPISDGESWEPGDSTCVVVMGAGATCLLMTVQRLLLRALEEGVISPVEHVLELDDELWIPQSEGGGRWESSLGIREALTVLHLQVGDGPEDEAG
jgi:hypothetical protein